MTLWPQIRSLLRAPAITASAVLTLALGVGAGTGAFSALRALLLKPLDYPDPDRLVSLYETTQDRKPRGVAEANLLDWRTRSALFEAMAVYQPRSFGLTLQDAGSVTVIQTGMVMADFFPVLAVPPALGRVFRENEEAAEGHFVVLTSRLWRSMFGSDPSVIGRTIRLNEEPYTITGVMPSGFEYAMGQVLPDAFIPLSRRDYCCGRVGSQEAIGRLRPGASIGAARSQLEGIAEQLAHEYPASNAGRSAGLRPLEEIVTGPRREPLFLLTGASLLVLLIACANVAGLVLARCLSRANEMAIRASLGAGAVDLALPFFAQAAMLTLASAGLGLFGSILVLRLVPSFIPATGRVQALRLDPMSLLVTVGLSLLVTILLGMAPTLLVRHGDLLPWMKGSAPASRSRFRAGLVITQVALSVVLLLSAGLLLRSLLRLLSTSPGFETAHALRFGIGLPDLRYGTDDKLIDFHHRLLERISALPGVENVGAVLRPPLRGLGAAGVFQIAGSNLPAPQRPRAWVNGASPRYFRTIGIPLLEGRDFSWRDDQAGKHRVVIVNQAFARAYLRDRPRLGTLLEMNWTSDLNPRGSLREIVGVVADTRQASMDREPVPEIFLSMTQIGADGCVYVIRGHGDDPSLPRAVAEAVAQQDPLIQRVHPEPLRLVVERSLGSRNATLWLIGGFGALALLLTAVGLYGIVAFRAAERAREMAIRSALGATAPELRRLVLGHSLRLAAGGVAAGLMVFFPASRLLAGQLFGVNAADPLSIASAICAVGLVAIGASAGPAVRASRTAPMELLRDR